MGFFYEACKKANLLTTEAYPVIDTLELGSFPLSGNGESPTKYACEKSSISN